MTRMPYWGNLSESCQNAIRDARCELDNSIMYETIRATIGEIHDIPPTQPVTDKSKPWREAEALVKSLHAEASASEELHPSDSNIEVMRAAAEWINKHSPALDEDHFNTLQELLSAVHCLPSVYDRIEAYMYGRNSEDPRAAIEALYNIAYAGEPVT